MWRSGDGLLLAAWIANAIALGFAAGFGARALLDPGWAARLVGLAPERREAIAEFRASYGGFCLGAHGLALLLSVHWIWTGAYETGVYASGAAAILAAAWAGACGGRALSMLREGARTRFNVIATGLAALIAFALASPWLVWWFSRPA
jgi:hypothetical protein